MKTTPETICKPEDSAFDPTNEAHVLEYQKGLVCEVKPEVGTYTDKNGVIHKYVGSLADYHNADLMCLMLNEADTDEEAH